ncbi:MAG: hypothetical protein HY788_23140 [Deltaproteobacteria bacterium]|nr:hypothetical protein [Deltaproteobacteria bacterium]
MNPLNKVLFVILILVTAAGCAGSVKGLPINDGVEKFPLYTSESRDHVQVQYLGVGGFLIRRGQHALLTAPFFSNPSMFRVAFGKIQSDPLLIEKFLPTVFDVRHILVAHTHYDHLMDIPYIAQYRSPYAKIYGCPTAKNILGSVLPEDRLVAIPPDAFAKPAGILESSPEGAPGKWWPEEGGGIRFMAIESEHAPHFCAYDHALCVRLFSGKVEKQLKTLPYTAYGWKEGDTVTYLIDFLGPDGKRVDFRIFYQDAAATAPYGIPPQSGLLDQKRIDLAILCVPGFNEVEGYPEGIIEATRPRFVLLAHWEDFFRPPSDDPDDLRVVPGSNPTIFIDRMKPLLPPDADYALPRPGAGFRFRVVDSD